MTRLKKLANTEPDRWRKVNGAGEAVARATNRGVQLSVAATFGACGVQPSSGFWDPNCGSSSKSCPAYDWWSCNSWWWWGCSSYWWPCGPRWSFGYCYDNFGFAWSYSPYYYGSYYTPYCAPPVYYSYAVYDYAAPAAYAPEEVVTYAAPVDDVPVGENVAPTTESPAGPIVERPHNPEITAELGRAATQYLTLGDQAFKQGRYGDAVHFYAKATELSPNDGVLHLILADALFATGDYHYAAYALRRALELDEALLDAIVDKHAFYGNPAEFDRQIEWLERYLEEHFLDDDARLLLAANYLFANRAAQAVELLESTFSMEVRETPAGRLILERSRALR